MRSLVALFSLLAAFVGPAALAQEQPGGAGPPAAGAAPYDLVAADRETAWRINRATGEIVICRLNTTAGLDSVAATCAPAAIGAAASGTTGGGPAGGPAQPSRLPPAGPPGAARP